MVNQDIRIYQIVLCDTADFTLKGKTSQDSDVNEWYRFI